MAGTSPSVRNKDFALVEEQPIYTLKSNNFGGRTQLTLHKKLVLLAKGLIP